MSRRNLIENIQQDANLLEDFEDENDSLMDIVLDLKSSIRALEKDLRKGI